SEGSAASAVRAPLQGTVTAIEVATGDAVHAGQALVVPEAMKLEHVIEAPHDGIVRAVSVAVGDLVQERSVLVTVEAAEVASSRASDSDAPELDRIRPDLAEVVERHALGLDRSRPEAVARRRKTGQRTARENVDDLVDPGTFVEYGPLVIA